LEIISGLNPETIPPLKDKTAWGAHFGINPTRGETDKKISRAFGATPWCGTTQDWAPHSRPFQSVKKDTQI